MKNWIIQKYFQHAFTRKIIKKLTFLFKTHSPHKSPKLTQYFSTRIKFNPLTRISTKTSQEKTLICIHSKFIRSPNLIANLEGFKHLILFKCENVNPNHLVWSLLWQRMNVASSSSWIYYKIWDKEMTKGLIRVEEFFWGQFSCDVFFLEYTPGMEFDWIRFN